MQRTNVINGYAQKENPPRGKEQRSKPAMDGNDLLMSGGIPSAKFPTLGTRVSGQILAEPASRQQTDAKTQEPKFFKSGDPMMSVVVRLQTAERDPMREGDDGERALYIKGKTIKAVREAVKRAGGKKLEVGGFLALTYVADEPPTGGLLSGAKVYAAEYTRPDPSSLPTDEAATMPETTFRPTTTNTTVYNTPPSTPPPATNPPLAQTVVDNLTEEQRKALAAIGYKV